MSLGQLIEDRILELQRKLAKDDLLPGTKKKLEKALKENLKLIGRK